MAESELAVLTTHRLRRRIPNKQALQERSTLGRIIATSITPRPIGNSQPTTPVHAGTDHLLVCGVGHRFLGRFREGHKQGTARRLRPRPGVVNRARPLPELTL